MRLTLTQNLLRHIQKDQLLRAGQRVGVAVSGGADSVALLLVLLELREKLGIVLSVVHFNHRLRGKASNTDELFVTKLAEKLGLPLHIGHGDVAARARRDKANLEDTARKSRYSFFAKLVAEGIIDVVATAHTADDQAETVLAHILRGAGLAGLSAIHPRTPHAVRPLLTVRRADLRKYLRTKKQKWREDATNQDVSRLRARIRKKLLPLLEKQFQPSAVVHLATLAHLAREDEAFLVSLAEQRASEISHPDKNGTRVSIADLLGPRNELLAGLSPRIVRLLAEKTRTMPGQWSADHVHSVLELARRGESGKLLQLPGGVDVRRDHLALVFSARSVLSRSLRKKSSGPTFSYPIDFLQPESSISVSELGCFFRFRSIDWHSTRRDTITQSCFALDRDRLRTPLELRNWRPGDRFRPAGRSSARKLKRLLGELRISSWERAGWPVLTSGGILIWARGFPAAAEFAADESTRTGIVISEEPL